MQCLAQTELHGSTCYPFAIFSFLTKSLIHFLPKLFDPVELQAFHLRCLRRILGITWQDKVPNNEVLSRAGIPSMYTLLRQSRLRWLGHTHRMADGRIPKDLLYGELAFRVKMKRSTSPSL